MFAEQQLDPGGDSTTAFMPDRRWIFHTTSAFILIIILAAFLIHWSIPSTGITIEVATGIISEIAAGSAAEQAGLQQGDQVLRFYDYLWSDSDEQLWLFPLDWRDRRGIPIQVRRDGTVIAVTMGIQPPAFDERLERVVWSLLACGFWLTGLLLSYAQTHQQSRIPLVAWVWLGLSAVTGVYHLASIGSYPLTIVLLWALITLGMPFCVYAHVWFPMRPMPATVAPMAWRWFVRSVLAVQAGLILLVIILRPTIAELRDLLIDLAAPALTIGLGVAGVILWRAYQQAMIAHTRRQIRLVAMACIAVAAGWSMFRIAPAFLGAETLLPQLWLSVLITLVPLAYLAGAFIPDLYRLDRLILRMGVHIGTALVLALCIGITVSLLDVHGPVPALWMAVVFVIGYRPLQRFGARLLPSSVRDRDMYTPLQRAAHTLTTTLDRDRLETALIGGIQATFGAPLGYYRPHDEDAEMLHLVHQQRLPLPAVITRATIQDLLGDELVIEHGRRLLASEDSQEANERDLLAYVPGVALWCQIRGAQQQVLGVLALGRRDDLDPYRPHDIAALRQLLDAAILALGHSAEYRERQQAEETIRALYRHMKQVQDLTAAEIARDIHDDVLNVAVVLNIQSLHELLQRTSDPDLRARIEEVLHSEQMVSRYLRQVCERLHPTGIDDPFGFAAVVRQHLEKVAAAWMGVCRLNITGAPIPMPITMQRELLRIVREAAVNAIKHSGGSDVAVTIQFQSEPQPHVTVLIRDNGRQHHPIRPRIGGWGLRNMMESARTLGGSLDFQQTPGGGTTVVVAVSVPPML